MEAYKNYYTVGEVISWIDPAGLQVDNELSHSTICDGQRNTALQVTYSGPSTEQTNARNNIKKQLTVNGYTPDDIAITDHILGAINKNPEFVSKLADEVKKIITKNKDRIGANRTTMFRDKRIPRGNDGSWKWHPALDMDMFSNANPSVLLNNIVITLKLLLNLGVVNDKTQLQVRSIDLVNGTGEWVVDVEAAKRRFSMDPHAKKKKFAYDSFTPTDIETVFLSGNTAMPCMNLYLISISVHTDHQQARQTGTPFAPKYAQNGATTVAGTLIFNSEPEIYMMGNFRDRENMKLNPDGSNLMPVPIITLSEQPFDLIQYARNEYGQAALRFILGMKITDVGYTLAMPDMQQEVVCTYVGGFFSPFYFIDADELKNEIDILGLGQDEESPIFSLRKAVAQGIMDPRDLYMTQWRSFFDANDQELQEMLNRHTSRTEQTERERNVQTTIINAPTNDRSIIGVQPITVPSTERQR